MQALPPKSHCRAQVTRIPEFVELLEVSCLIATVIQDLVGRSQAFNVTLSGVNLSDQALRTAHGSVPAASEVGRRGSRCSRARAAARTWSSSARKGQLPRSSKVRQGEASRLSALELRSMPTPPRQTLKYKRLDTLGHSPYAGHEVASWSCHRLHS